MKHFGDLVLDLQDLTGDPNNKVYGLAQKKRFLNKGYQKLRADIYKIRPGFYLKEDDLAITSGTYTVDLPSDCSEKIDYIKDENGMM